MSVPLLEELHRWMLTHPDTVKRARVGDIEIELLPPSPKPVERPAPKPRSQEDMRRDEKERKRARYSLELGHPVPDEMLDRLP